eukprot:m.827377 g.827377  ORF g.827377 m.827377 type:complete len:52 (-) comp23415_c0_seq7:729-884(-)
MEPDATVIETIGTSPQMCEDAGAAKNAATAPTSWFSPARPVQWQHEYLSTG